jgi:uncharacterized protein
MSEHPILEDSGMKDSGPERTCVLTRRKAPAEDLLRVVVGPEGQIVPDFAGRLPGRGAWIALDRAALERAIEKRKLAPILSRALHIEGQTLQVPDGLADQIAQQLMRRALDRLGLENKAGHLTFGFDRIQEAIARGKVFALIHAGDAASDGVNKLANALKALRPTAWCIGVPAGRDDLSLALGRVNVVHAAVLHQGAADRLGQALSRWRSFVGQMPLENAA